MSVCSCTSLCMHCIRAQAHRLGYLGNRARCEPRRAATGFRRRVRARRRSAGHPSLLRPEHGSRGAFVSLAGAPACPCARTDSGAFPHMGGVVHADAQGRRARGRRTDGRTDWPSLRALQVAWARGCAPWRFSSEGCSLMSNCVRARRWHEASLLHLCRL